MTDAIVSYEVTNQSPFDSIRRFDGQGNEFWYARELMPLLGYKKWERFEGSIERAKTSCNNSGNLDCEHFFPEAGKSLTKPKDDFKLSRYACYLIAMNGDPRKPEIAMAQSYFAVKTREAETVIPAQNDRIRELELRAKIAELEHGTSQNNVYLESQRKFIYDVHGPQTLALIQGRPDAVVEKIEKVTETIVCRNGRNVTFEGKSTAEFGKELDFKTGKAFERWLIDNNLQHVICEGLRAVQAPYIPTEYIPEIKRVWAQKRKSNGTQLMIGE